MVVAPNWDAVLAIMIPNIVGAVCAIPLIGQISNKDGTAWYQKIKKPSWIIADWAFGAYYAVMYTSYGYASYLVYAEPGGIKEKFDLVPTGLYAIHLLLTVSICTSLYKFHKFALTFFLVLVLDGLMMGLTVSFYNVNTYTPIFLIPVQIWQVYATLLIHALWVLNDSKADDCEILTTKDKKFQNL